MNNEEWKNFRDERIKKIRDGLLNSQEKQQEKTKHHNKKNTTNKKGNSKKYVAKKKNFYKKKQLVKAVEKPAPGANVNTITFSPVIYGTAPAAPQQFAPQPHPLAHPQPFPPMFFPYSQSPMWQHHQNCQCNFCSQMNQ